MPPKKRPTKNANSGKMTAKELMAEVNAVMGADSVFMGSDKSLQVEYLSTGLLPFDILLQGGFPKGRMSLIYGDWSTLKSLVGLMTCGQTQKDGGTAAIIDTEHAYDPKWAKQMGINTDDLIVWPRRDDEEEHSGEEAVDTAQVLTANGVDLIVFDSVAAAMPQAESAKRLKGESIQPARLAQLMSAATRRLTAVNNKTAFIFINQTRVNIGITFGSNEAHPGGKALPFYASYIMNVRKTGKITKDVKVYTGEKWTTVKEQHGQVYKAELTKSKLNKPFREVWFTWDMKTGQIDLPGFLIAQGLETGLVQQKGNTWSYGNVKAVGREKFKDALANNSNAMMQLEMEVRDWHGLPQIVTIPQNRKVVRRSTGKPVVVKKTVKRLRRA
ncbi:MAG: hypothetical protein WBO55_10290 [Rhizobiaceae bacterium]